MNTTGYWTEEELRAAIERCEDDVARMVEARATPEEIYGRRQGIDVLYRLLEDASGGRDSHGPAGLGMTGTGMATA